MNERDEQGPVGRPLHRRKSAARWIALTHWIAAFMPFAIHAQERAAPASQTGQWGPRAALVEPVSEHAVAELNGKIYVIAGNTNNGGTVATVQVYDVAADRWTLTNPLPIAVNHNVAAAANGKLYVFGGQTASQTASPFTDAVYEYDPATAEWTSRAPMPTKRSAGGAAVINGKIYVAGGRPPQGHDFAVYDPAANTWTTLPDLPTQRNHLAVGAINGKVYVAGGRFEAGNSSPMTDALEIYDPATNRWSEGARMPTVRGGVNGVVANGCLHVFGGEGNAPDPKGMFHEHEVYNPASNTWTKLPNMPIPVHGVTGGTFLNGLIYLPAGARARGGGERSDLLQAYRPPMSCR